MVNMYVRDFQHIDILKMEMGLQITFRYALQFVIHKYKYKHKWTECLNVNFFNNCWYKYQFVLYLLDIQEECDEYLNICIIFDTNICFYLYCF